MAKLALPSLAGLASQFGRKEADANEGFLMRRGPTIATIALVAIAAWLGTTWFWHFWPDGAPPAASAQARGRPSLSAAALGETVASANVFGAGARAQAAAEAVSTLNVKLKGVFAGRSATPGAAIVNNGQKDEFVSIGTEVLPGVVLEEVYPTHVVLRRGGQLERVNMEERIVAGGAGRPGLPPRPSAPMFMPSQPAPPAGNAVTNIPPASPPPGVTPNAGEVKAPPPAPNLPPPANAVPGVPPQLGQPQAGADLGRFGVTAAGLSIEDVPSGGMLARSGLQAGDVVKSVNGQAITSAADLARVAQLAASGQTIRGEIVRDGRVVPIRIRATR